MLGVALTSNAQTTWLTKDFKETIEAEATYFKVVLKKESSVSYFYKNGSVYRKLNSLDGKLEGVFSEFYKTGELKISGRYKNGLEDGVWKTFNRRGKIIKKGKYSKGEKVGVWKTFYKNHY